MIEGNDLVLAVQSSAIMKFKLEVRGRLKSRDVFHD
jgi:hypothetical protein